MNEMEVMEYIYQKDEIWVNLIDFFIKRFQEPTDSLYNHLRHILQDLKDRNLVDFSDANYRSLGHFVTRYPPALGFPDDCKLTFEEFNRRNELKKANGENYGIFAQLTIDGRIEIEKKLAEKQIKDLNQSIIDTNKSVSETNDFQKSFGNRSLILGALTTFFILTTTYQQCRDKSEQELQGIKIQLQKIDTTLKHMQPYPLWKDSSMKN